MSRLYEIGRRVRMLFRGGRFDRELDEEMQLHIQLRQEKLRAEGLSDAEALRRARRRFGNSLRLREQSRDVWRWRWLDDVGRDLRSGARQLRAAPGFTIDAISLLTLGAGVALSALHVANAAQFHILAVQDADRLVRVARQSPELTSSFPFMSATFYREQSTLFSFLVAESIGLRVSVDGDTEPRAAAFVSGN
ncbi:MAG TPA: permease prefix domain 1-containing protein [Vicinamibacterales bacterium]|nr:permease prefix domain 1-containing protein [Vicinamibacterales bacterium]